MRSIYNKRKGKKRWIRKAVKKKGGLSRQLNIPEKENIPVSLLKKIRNAKIGTTITNPTKTGKKKIKVTRKLKRRAVLALTLKKLGRKKKKRKRKRK